MSAQKVMIVQIPSEANAEHLINLRVNEATAEGWQIVQMMDHNGFLVLLLERCLEPVTVLSTICAVCAGSSVAANTEKGRAHDERT